MDLLQGPRRRTRRAAAWLYAQFVTSKTTSLKKSIVGLTFIRDSDIRTDYFTRTRAKYGGLIEFYRSPARVAWTPTGTNVPDYPKLAQLWWKNVAVAVDRREDAAGGDGQPGRRDGRRDGPPGGARAWPTARPSSTRRATADQVAERQGRTVRKKLANEKPKGETIAYDTLLKSWPATPPKR